METPIYKQVESMANELNDIENVLAEYIQCMTDYILQDALNGLTFDEKFEFVEKLATLSEKLQKP